MLLLGTRKGSDQGISWVISKSLMQINSMFTPEGIPSHLDLILHHFNQNLLISEIKALKNL